MNETQLLREALIAALEWIDAVPKDLPLPAMPGFDRDDVDALLALSHPTAAEQPQAPEQGVVAWQFFDKGQWHNGDDRIKDHRQNTEAAGYPVRNLFATPPAPKLGPNLAHRHPKRSAEWMQEIAELEDAAGGVFAAGALASKLEPMTDEQARHMAIGASIECAARDLPHGYELQVIVERGAGYATVTCPEVDIIAPTFDGDHSLAEQVDGCIDAAKRHEATHGNWKRDNQATQDLISLGSEKLAMLSVIEKWTDEQCQQAEAWASARHFRASDNAASVPEMPPHVAALPERARGAWDTDLSHM